MGKTVLRDADDLRVLRTREDIKKAFIQMLYESDYNSITVAKLMNKAGYNRGTFYLHFQNTWEVYEEVVAEYVRDMCLCYELEYENDLFSMDEKAFLMMYDMVNTVKRWYPLGRSLLKKEKNPDIFPKMIENYVLGKRGVETIMFPSAGMKYVNADHEIAKETIIRYSVAMLVATFDCAAEYVRPRMTKKELAHIAEEIHEGNVGWVQYEHHMNFHVICYNEELAQKHARWKKTKK